MMGKKKDKPNSFKNVGGDEVEIRIYMTHGSGVPYLRTSLKAIETSDGYGGLNFENVNSNFFESADFSLDEVYMTYNTTLMLSKTKESKLKILDSTIAEQRRLVKGLRDYPILCALKNLCDEEVKLKHLEIMRTHVQFTESELGGKHGAYFSIENGIRVYSFMPFNGRLVPYWWNSSQMIKIADNVTKEKQRAQEDAIFEMQMKQLSRENAQAASLLIMVAIVSVLIIAGLIWTGWNYNEGKKIIQSSLADTLTCSETTIALSQELRKVYNNAQISTLINQTIALRDSEIEEREARIQPIPKE